jgi:hypothetical protein
MKRKLQAIFGTLVLITCAPAFAFSPSDLALTFLGISQGQPIYFQTGMLNLKPFGVTVDEYLKMPYGSSVDLIASIKNLTDSPITFSISNPPTAISPLETQVVLSGFFSQQVPIGGNWNGLGPVVEFASSPPFGHQGSQFTLAPGQALTTKWGTFTSANLAPATGLDAMFFGLTAASITGAYIDAQGSLDPLVLDHPFYVAFSAPVPEPSSIALAIAGLALVGMSKGARQWKCLTRSK